jgi:hypothetical protein
MPKGSIVVLDRGYVDYRLFERWQIELFFKAIKQNLKIKTIVGTSTNGVRIQIWTALIAIVLFKLLQMRSKLGWALSNLLALQRLNLFTYRDLWAWIDNPYTHPPNPHDANQLVFVLDSICTTESGQPPAKTPTTTTTPQ